jgi:Mn-dependent DtxR family transcriptional regulator
MSIFFTDKQGQYLAFIHMYTLVNGTPPAQADMQRFFRVTPPTVHRMVIELESRGLIHRVPGSARSLRVAIQLHLLPQLRPVVGG